MEQTTGSHPTQQQSRPSGGRRFGHLNLPMMVLLAALVAAIGYQAGGNRAAAPRSTAIATVNLATVLEGLAQRGEAEAALRAMTTEIEAEREQREAKIRQFQTQLRDSRAAAGDAAPTESEFELAEQIELESLQYQAWLTHMSEKLDLERSLLLQDLYRAIRRSATDLASAEGLDLVLVDDSQAEIQINPDSRTPREVQVQQQMRQRKVLHASQATDITHDLIERMNNEYRAGEAR